MRRDDIQKIVYDNVRIRFNNNELNKQWSEYIINHFLYRINKFRENFKESFEFLKESFNNLVEVYRLYDQDAVFIKILKYYMKGLLFSSYLADQELTKKKEKVNCVDECGRVFMSFFSKFSNGDDKSSMFYCVICLTRIYFKLKTYRNSKTLIDWVGNSLDIEEFPKSEVTTFYYYSGRLSLYELRLTDANKILNIAFKLCKDNHFANKRLLLEYLVPLKLFEGIIPSEYIIKKYNLEQYNDLIRSFKEGNLTLFEKAIEDLEDRLITLGTFLIVEKLKPFVMRNLIKSIFSSYSEELAKMKTPVIKLELIHNVLTNVIAFNSMDIEELEIYIISVIFKGLINGYVHNVNKVIVFSKQLPFPKLSDAYKNNYNKII
jgi:hypothetical protein